MDYFNRLQNLINLRDLCSWRTQQLSQEIKMDEKLSKVYGTCSRETFEFVMELRRLQRKYSMETYTSSIMDYPENVRKNLVKGDIFFSMFFSGPKDEEEKLSRRPEEERQMLCEKITEMTKILKNS